MLRRIQIDRLRCIQTSLRCEEEEGQAVVVGYQASSCIQNVQQTVQQVEHKDTGHLYSFNLDSLTFLISDRNSSYQFKQFKNYVLKNI